FGADGVAGGTGANADVSIVRLGFSAISLNIGDGLLTVSNGAGAFVVTSAGFAGRFSGDIALGVTGISLEGGLAVEVNTGGAAVDETFRVGGQTINLQLTAGPYFRVAGDD